ADVWIGSCEPIGECFHECDDLILLGIRQSEVTDRHVLILRDLGCRPAVYFFNCSSRAVSGLDLHPIHVARIVEVDELLQALDVTIVEELFLEVGTRSIRTACALRRYKGYIACGHGLHLTVGLWRKLRPTRVRAGSSRVTTPEKFAQAKIGICDACGVRRKPEGIRRALIINGDSRVLRQTEV